MNIWDTRPATHGWLLWAPCSLLSGRPQSSTLSLFPLLGINVCGKLNTTLASNSSKYSHSSTYVPSFPTQKCCYPDLSSTLTCFLQTPFSGLQFWYLLHHRKSSWLQVKKYMYSLFQRLIVLKHFILAHNKKYKHKQK